MDSFNNIASGYSGINKVDGVETASLMGGAAVVQKPAAKQFRILLVDDDPEDQLLMAELIEESFETNFNFVIDEASNYADAVAKLSHTSYDLAILDYKLGYKNGLDLLKRVKELGLNLPVIFVTGQGDEHTAVEAIKGGAVDYLIKGELSVDLVTKTFSKFFQVNKSSLSSSIKKFISAHKEQGKQDSVDLKVFMNLDKLVNFEPRPLFMKAKYIAKQGVDYSLFMHLDKVYKA
ncbi:MAG: response regulator [Cyanobacteria bacterium]|nr:response regulator [Cyanobacteriota bacterium]MDA1020206.1 response regulator [Cyanobacteriota bacterium]